MNTVELQYKYSILDEETRTLVSQIWWNSLTSDEHDKIHNHFKSSNSESSIRSLYWEVVLLKNNSWK